MKKIIVFLLLLAGCGGDNAPDTAESESPAESEKIAEAVVVPGNISFTQIPFFLDEMVGPGRGAENWANKAVVPIPGFDSPDSSWDTYNRFAWLDIQDYLTGAFKWGRFDSAIQYAIDNGKKFNFGIFAFYPGEGINLDKSSISYPLSLHKAMQEEPVYKDVRDIDGEYAYNSWTPNWNSPSFRSAYNTLMDGVILHLKKTVYKKVRLYDAVGYVDIRTFGFTGEWTGYNAKTLPENMPSNIIASAETQIQFISDYIDRWPDKQLTICIGSVLGTTVEDGASPPEVGHYVFTSSNKYGRIGLRRDCLGQTDEFVHRFLEKNSTVYKGMIFKDQIMNLYKVAPINGEPCSCCTTNGGAMPYWDLPRQISFYHISSFGNGNFKDITKRGQDSVRQASKLAGYRLAPITGNLERNLLTLTWRNSGIAPAYENWDVSLELRSSGKLVWAKKSKFKPRLFLPGTIAITDTLSNGTGDLYLVCKDPTGYRKPLPLAIKGRNSDGSYLISSNITIGPGESAQVSKSK